MGQYLPMYEAWAGAAAAAFFGAAVVDFLGGIVSRDGYDEVAKKQLCRVEADWK